MKSIYNIYESILSDVDATLHKNDAVANEYIIKDKLRNNACGQLSRLEYCSIWDSILDDITTRRVNYKGLNNSDYKDIYLHIKCAKKYIINVCVYRYDAKNEYISGRIFDFKTGIRDFSIGGKSDIESFIQDTNDTEKYLISNYYSYLLDNKLYNGVLSESILGDIDDNIGKNDNAVETIQYFGGNFKLLRAVNVSDITAGMLNANALKKVTKGMDYIDPNIKNGVFDKRNKFKMFANWVSNLKLSDLGFKYNDIDIRSRRFRWDLANELNKKCFDNGFFNNELYTNIYCTNITGNELEIMLSRHDKINTAMKFVYELVK